MAGKGQLKIKTGVVQRTLRELQSYQSEVRDNERDVARVRSGSDHSRLRQWEAVLAETRAMIPDTTNRLSAAVADLDAALRAPPPDADPADLAAARAALDAASDAIADSA